MALLFGSCCDTWFKFCPHHVHPNSRDSIVVMELQRIKTKKWKQSLEIESKESVLFRTSILDSDNQTVQRKSWYKLITWPYNLLLKTTNRTLTIPKSNSSGNRIGARDTFVSTDSICTASQKQQWIITLFDCNNYCNNQLSTCQTFWLSVQFSTPHLKTEHRHTYPFSHSPALLHPHNQRSLNRSLS